MGSSYLASDINAAYLYPQLLQADEINQDRLKSWNLYYSLLKPFCESSNLELPYIPRKCIHNAHMFYIKVRDLTVRTALIQHLKERNILAVSHYVPLHTAAAGSQYSRFHGEDIFTTRESNRILRLPMYYGLLEEEIIEVVSSISSFFVGKGRI